MRDFKHAPTTPPDMAARISTKLAVWDRLLAAGVIATDIEIRNGHWWVRTRVGNVLGWARTSDVLDQTERKAA
jgi:hypothetical protein